MPSATPHIDISACRQLATVLLLLVCSICRSQAPANDNCANAIEISVAANGFGLGNLTNATVQTGETYASAIFVGRWIRHLERLATATRKLFLGAERHRKQW